MAHPFPFWSPGCSSPDVPSSPSATDEPSADPPSFHSNGAFPARFDWAAGPPRFFPVESTFARAAETLLPEESPFAAAARALATPPPFLTKTFDMVEDPATNTIVSWGPADNSFVVWDHHAFSRDLLPRCFKHNCFSNFVRQLNAYGFRKVNPNRWEFANEGFQRGRKDLLKSIQRRKPVFQSHQQQVLLGAGGPYLEVGKYGGAQGEVESLRRDKNLLMLEVVRLRQKQRSTEQGISLISQHLHTTEQRQQQMMTFLAKAMKNPILMAHLVQQNEQMKGFQTIAKRRCLPSAGTNNEETGL